MLHILYLYTSFSLPDLETYLIDRTIDRQNGELETVVGLHAAAVHEAGVNWSLWQERETYTGHWLPTEQSPQPLRSHDWRILRDILVPFLRLLRNASCQQRGGGPITR